MGFRNVTFGVDTGYDPLPGEELNDTLVRWANQFSGDEFAKHLPKDWGNFWEIDYDSAAQHIDLLADRLAKVLSELRSL